MNSMFKQWTALAVVVVVMSFSAALAQGIRAPATPVIVTQPQGAELVGDDATVVLSVEAVVNDGGELFYSWYAGHTEDKTGGRPIPNNVSSENVLLVNNPGATVYYWVNVTNVAPGGGKAWVESDVAMVVGTQRQNATTPIILIDRRDIHTVVGKSMRLSAYAVTLDGGTLSYQWFGDADKTDAAGWTPIDGATGEYYDSDASVAGTFYYRVVATNTNNAVEGNKTASRTSYVVTVRVGESGANYAAIPDVSGIKPAREGAIGGDTAIAPILSVDANVSDGGTLSYQWYRTSSDSDVGGEPIEGATESAFDPSGDMVSDAAAYYYVEVTNSKSADVGGEALTAVATSAPVRVITSVGGITAVQINEHVIPQPKPAVGVAAITPAKPLTVGFAAGPNPVGRQFGAVGFFRSGSRIASASLSVYDAFGNAVKKITVRDTAGSGGKRAVGSWDLRDASGRAVPEGAYLVRGAIKTSGGKTERVSAVIGVR